MNQYTIGFANQDERNPFAVLVRKNLEQAAQKHQLNLITRDNNLNTPTAITNAQAFADQDVDLAIIFHIDERSGGQVAQPLRMKRIPIISLDIPIAFTTFFGVNVRSAAVEAGQAMVDWVQANWGGQVDRILVMMEYRTLDTVQQRFSIALDVIQAALGFDDEIILRMDHGGTRELTLERVMHVMKNWQDHHHIIIMNINDNIAAGALQAVRVLNREQDVAVMSYDGTAIALNEFKRPSSRLIVSPSFRAEAYGEGLVELALKMLNGEHVPAKNYVEPVCLTRDNFDRLIEAYQLRF